MNWPRKSKKTIWPWRYSAALARYGEFTMPLTIPSTFSPGYYKKICSFAEINKPVSNLQYLCSFDRHFQAMACKNSIHLDMRRDYLRRPAVSIAICWHELPLTTIWLRKHLFLGCDELFHWLWQVPVCFGGIILLIISCVELLDNTFTSHSLIHALWSRHNDVEYRICDRLQKR